MAPPTDAVARPSPPVETVALVSLGCAKNLVDSEKMLGLLAEGGLVPISEMGDADAIVINTCGFLEASRVESVEQIRAAAACKREGRCRRLVVAGCLVQRHRARLLQWCQDIDALVGVFDRDRVVEAVRGDRPDRPHDTEGPAYSSIAGNAVTAARQRHIAAPGYFESDQARLRLTPRHYAYLRLSEGCNQNCTFCTIPSIRGKMRSKPVDRIVAEMEELIADGAFELLLIGQDTTSYGEDLGDADGLVGLLNAMDRTVARTAGTGWLRLMYAYPTSLTDAMIDAIGQLPHVVKYLDMPLQHISDRVLGRMRRHTTRRDLETLIERLRRRVPGIALRTTLISGFPGETDAEHEELVAFVRDTEFEALGVFPYSPEPGTPAARMHADGDAVDPACIEARIEALMLTQQANVFARNEAAAREGQEETVLIDAVEAGDDGLLGLGRSRRQAPDIDGIHRVIGYDDPAPGELVRCRVVAADGYDLVARPVATFPSESGVTLPVVS